MQGLEQRLSSSIGQFCQKSLVSVWPSALDPLAPRLVIWIRLLPLRPSLLSLTLGIHCSAKSAQLVGLDRPGNFGVVLEKLDTNFVDLPLFGRISERAVVNMGGHAESAQ